MDKSALEALIGRLEVWALIFGVVVAIGVAGESVFGIRLWWNNRKLQAIQRSENTRLLTDIAEANARSAEANLEIEKLKTPRRLSPEQQQRIASKLTAFAGQKFSLSVGQEPEQLNLLDDVRRTLISSGWIKVAPTGLGDINIGDAALAYGTGLVPRFSPNVSDAARKAANALAEACSQEGIASKTEPDARVADPSEINVLVGVKPMR